MKQILVITTGFEPVTVCLEGRCSIQLSYVTLYFKKNISKMSLKGTLMKYFIVGAAGFEPATSWSQTRRDDRTTLRPEIISNNLYQMRRDWDSNPGDGYPPTDQQSAPLPLRHLSVYVYELIISVLRLQRYNDFSFLASFSQTFFNIFYKIFIKQLFIKHIVFIYFYFRKNISLIFLYLFSSKIVLRHLFYIECRRYQTAKY